jgi:excisionase family DNA binding protein
VFFLIKSILSFIREQLAKSSLHIPALERSDPKFFKKEAELMNEISDFSRLTLSVQDVENILGIGKNKAYDLVHSGCFPVLTIGKKMIIPKETFFTWLNGGCRPAS